MPPIKLVWNWWYCCFLPEFPERFACPDIPEKLLCLLIIWKRKLALQTRHRRAAADMADPEKNAEWQAVANASHGKFKTARGAAFAVYYNQGSGME